jgi:hypothetical protein
MILSSKALVKTLTPITKPTYSRAKARQDKCSLGINFDEVYPRLGAHLAQPSATRTQLPPKYVQQLFKFLLKVIDVTQGAPPLKINQQVNITIRTVFTPSD